MKKTELKDINVLEVTSAYRRVEDRYRVRERKLDKKVWMKWLIDFTQADFSQFSEGDWLNCRHELSAFLVFVSARGRARELREIQKNKTHSPTTQRPQVISGYGLLSSEVTIQAQHKLKDILTEFLVSDSVTLGSFTINLYLMRVNDGQWLVEDIKEATQKLVYYAAILLELYGDKILRCPECNRLFLTDRKDQKFDAVKCQNKAAIRLFKQQHPEKGVEQINKKMKLKKDNTV